MPTSYETKFVISEMKMINGSVELLLKSIHLNNIRRIVINVKIKNYVIRE
jgi:hypothetical protein